MWLNDQLRSYITIRRDGAEAEQTGTAIASDRMNGIGGVGRF
jgi:hypothetical protein